MSEYTFKTLITVIAFYTSVGISRAHETLASTDTANHMYAYQGYTFQSPETNTTSSKRVQHTDSTEPVAIATKRFDNISEVFKYNQNKFNKKTDFETENDFALRCGQFQGKEFVLNIITDNNRKSHCLYNPETNQLVVTPIYLSHNIADNQAPSKYKPNNNRRILQIRSETRRIKHGNYVGQNAFGVSVNVNARDLVETIIALHTQDKKQDVGDLDVVIPMDAELAKSTFNKIGLLAYFTPICNGSWVTHTTADYHAPTIQTPVDGHYVENYISARIDRIVIYNKSTMKTIVERQFTY